MKGQKGLTLLEVVIAVAVFGIIAAGLFMALNVSLKATATTDRLTIAESLTRSELEYIKSWPYDYWEYDPDAEPPVNDPPDYGDPNSRIPPEHSSYSITLTAVPIDPETHVELVIPPDSDLGIQKVTVEVYFEGELIVTTVDYKVDR